MYKKTALLSLAFIVSTLGLSAEVLKYEIDPVHSGVSFKIRHFLNKIPGAFASFEGEIHYDAETPANSMAIAKIEVKSVDTRNEKRDGHLQSEDYFNAAENPLISFSSTEWVATGDNTYTVKGMLTMLGVAKPVELDVTYLGEVEGRGKFRSGWEGTTTISRAEWGLTSGTPAVGDEVEIELNIQATR